MIRWTGLAPWEFEFPFPGSLTSTFLSGPGPPETLGTDLDGERASHARRDRQAGRTPDYLHPFIICTPSSFAPLHHLAD